jgi:microcystin degradation protein MlrC
LTPHRSEWRDLESTLEPDLPISYADRMRVGIIAFLHESNTFIEEPTGLERFREDTLLTGEPVRERFVAAHHEVGGFFEGLASADIEAVPLLAARALPYGTIPRETYDLIVEMMLGELDRAGDLDGLLVAPHGATVSEAERDADGHWLGLLRERVGPDVPVIATLDLHANLTPLMVDATTAIVAYGNNPHTDQRQRGLEAATLMARTLRREIRVTQAAAFPPIAINIESQLTSEPPCLPLFQEARRLAELPGVLSTSILLGFPYADVPEMGSSVLVATENDLPLAKRLAGELAGYLWERREKFTGNFTPVAAALDRAVTLEGPICLLDMGDNVGGGSPGDGTFLAGAIQARKLRGAFVCLYDPESVLKAERAGVGARVHLDAGGKTDARHGAPVKDDFTVVGLHDGKFEEPEARHGGFTSFDQGRTAIVRSDPGLTLMLTSRRAFPVSLRQLSSCGLDPKHFHLLVAKGVQAPVAAYEPVCRHLIRVDTPGITRADMKQLEYVHRRRPMFPFESDAVWP